MRVRVDGQARVGREVPEWPGEEVRARETGSGEREEGGGWRGWRVEG